ncbi:FMN-dependent dehydrogenase [Diaporthe helianthi]|uniref:FMN-dependent dehydrogenase n=1 Tax=Diaporthe helianthi TaxID=158607 RepID=A0A2P5HJS7_DIAHE|nr:FMN-dependent dehydrogenase [Diaporthe helianthi]
MTRTQEIFDRAKAMGASAIALTVDSAMGTNRHRSWRLGVNERHEGGVDFFSWETYAAYTNMTDLPVILKGAQTVEDVREAAAHKVPAVILSNVSFLSLFCPCFVALPYLHFLTCDNSGFGRPFYFANQYSADGVTRAADLLKYEIAHDAANIGL